MDYEKKYKEALEIAKSFMNPNRLGVATKEELVQIFPELKESEDERIRNLIYLSIEKGMGIPNYKDRKKALAWLEKQGQQVINLPKWRYKKDNSPLLNDSLILNKYGCVAKSPSGALVSDVWVIDYDELAKLPKEEYEKQGEQKPIDKVEPKFKTGDKIKFIGEPTYPAREIITIKDDAYYFDEFVHLPFSKQDEWELVGQKPNWSEEDEKIKECLINSLARISANTRTDSTSINYTFSREIDWLKSLKPQKQWKPTKEQMYMLNWLQLGLGEGVVAEKARCVMESLYNDLKAL